jgi:hypothetical protein
VSLQHGYRNSLGEDRVTAMMFQQSDAVMDPILLDWFFGTETGSPTYFGILKRWTGTQWVKAKLKRYTGSTWVAATLKRWDGSSWKLVDTTGV